MPNEKLLEDYLDAQREATRAITLLVEKVESNTKAVEELRKGLSNGVIGKLSQKIEGMYIAILGILIPIAIILIRVMGGAK